MRILTRYVLREFLIPLFYCLTGFVSIYVLFDLFSSFARMMDADLSAGDAILYFCGYFAPYFHFIAPAALLLATLYTMWSFCRHSEIIAMRASGVSFLAIVKPLLAVAVLLGLGVVYVNESFVPARAQWASQLKSAKFDSKLMEKADNVIYRNAACDRTWNVNTVLDGEGAHLSGVRVSVDRPNGGTRLLNVTAARADYLDGEWWLTDARVQHYNDRGQEVQTRTPELDALRFRCFPEFRERPVDFIMQNRPWRFNSVQDRFRFLRTHPELPAEMRRDCIYDTWSQIMAPFACLIITLFAIPAGIASGRQSVFRGILGALGLYFSFYGLTVFAMVLAKNGFCPPILAAVLPHVVFIALGVRLFWKQR